MTATDAAAAEARTLADHARDVARQSVGRVDERALEQLGTRLGAAGAALRVRLARDRDLAGDAARVAELCDLLIEVGDLQQELRECVLAARFEVLGRVHAGLIRLRRLSDPDELLRAAPDELCACCDFDRVLISQVDGRSWLPHTWAVAPGADGPLADRVLEYLEGRAIELTPSLIETEVARRAAPALVSDPATQPVHRPLVETTRTRGYVVAPLLQGRRVFGLLHADAYVSGRPLTALDRDNIWTFAEGFGRVFERVALLRGLAEERARIEQAFRSAEAEIDRLINAELTLERMDRAPEVADRTGSALIQLTASPISRLLTSRELEVLELMISGARNSSIAAELIISEGTVKSHVKNICRKLRVSSRAEAISKYLQIAARTGAAS